MPIAIAIALLVLGSIVFHLVSPWWKTPIASNWGSIDTALDVTLWICAVAFIVLNLFMAYALW
ncbi:MAG TPA: cytochrome-c oxidase, partial [Rhizorhapis sp.]|nr:cytochrome-c oxidase [Rhizorhapis sp.]